MLEPKELLAPTAALFAVVIAIFVFMFPRALEIYRARQSAVSEMDVPDDIRKRPGFKIGASGDVLLLSFTSVLLFFLGAIYCPALLYRIANFYLGSTNFRADQILSDFRDFVFAFGILSALASGAIITLFINDVFVSEKKLPVLVKIYLRNILGQRVGKAETDKLLPESKRLFKIGAYGEAILNSVASLEIALKSRFNLPLHLSFGRVIIDLREELGKIVPVEELNNIRRIRNIAAHPSPERKVTKKDAEQALRLVGSILQRLQGDYYVILTPEAQEQLNKIQRRYYNLVNKAISALGQEPRPQRTRKLVEDGLWVIKVGQYRVIYSIDDEKRQITVMRITEHTEDA